MLVFIYLFIIDYTFLQSCERNVFCSMMNCIYNSVPVRSQQSQNICVSYRHCCTRHILSVPGTGNAGIDRSSELPVQQRFNKSFCTVHNSYSNNKSYIPGFFIHLFHKIVCDTCFEFSLIWKPWPLLLLWMFFTSLLPVWLACIGRTSICWSFRGQLEWLFLVCDSTD